jgi:ABC-type spermidine/putrescine transport system permease subunit II
MGVSLLVLFVQFLNIPLGFTTMIIAHTTFCFPFVLVAVQARLQGLDPSQEEAAMDLGATPFQSFWKITLPSLPLSRVAFPISLSMNSRTPTTNSGVSSRTSPESRAKED